MVVLTPHTRDGATLFAKNSDRSPHECQPLSQSVHRIHPAGATVHCQYLEIPQVAETAAVVGSRPFWLWGFEHGLNEYGVAIGNEAVLSRAAAIDRVLGMDFVRLGLSYRRRRAHQRNNRRSDRTTRTGRLRPIRVDFRYCGGFIIADHVEATCSKAPAASGLPAVSRIAHASRIDSRSTPAISARLKWRAMRVTRMVRGSNLRLRRRVSSRNAGKDKSDPLQPADAGTQPRTGRTQRPPHAARCSRYCATTARAARCLPPASLRSRRFADAMHARRGLRDDGEHDRRTFRAQADTIPVMWASLAAPCTSIAFPLFVAARFLRCSLRR